MDFKPLNGREFPRFSGIKTFFRLPIADIKENFDVALFGIPYDGAVSYRPGARFAPSAVREASSLGRGYHWDRGFNFFEKIKVADIGDCPVVPIDQQQTYHKIETFVSQVLGENKKFISVGGDHSTTLPILRALKKHYKQKINFIHFDAHLDTYPAAWGCEFHHGSFARHALEEGLVNPENMIQIGIRGPLAGGDDLSVVKKFGVRVVTVDEIRSTHLEQFLLTLPSFNDGITYISYDVDNLDPAFAPGTGTPVPGGLTTYESQRILRALKIKNLVGADIVELCPAYDPTQITALAAMDAMFEFLCLYAK